MLTVSVLLLLPLLLLLPERALTEFGFCWLDLGLFLLDALVA